MQQHARHTDTVNSKLINNTIPMAEILVKRIQEWIVGQFEFDAFTNSRHGWHARDSPKRFPHLSQGVKTF